MNRLDYDIAFPLSRMLARDVAPRSRLSGIVWSADFFSGAYRRGGLPVGLEEAVSASRASEALMVGADGVYRAFGIDAPPVVDGVGLDIRGRHSSEYPSTDDISNAAYWPRFSGVASAANDFDLGAVTLTTVTEIVGTDVCGIAGPASGYRPSYPDAGDYVAIGLIARGTRRYVIFGAAAGDDAYIVFDTQTGTITNSFGSATGRDAAATEIADGVWLVSIEATFAGSSSCLMRIQSSPGASQNSVNPSFVLDGMTLIGGAFAFVPGSVVPPVMLSSGNNSVTRDATDISVPGFDALAATCGLAGGFRIATTIDLSHLSDPGVRCLFAAGDGMADHIRMEITATGTVKATVRNASHDDLVLETGAFTMAGEKTVTLTASSGGWALEATGVSGDSDAGSYTMPPLNMLRHGSRFGDSDYLNGVVKQSRIERVG